MEQSSPEATAWDTWADYYDLADGDRAPHVEFYSSLLGDRTRSILELGCGTGTMVSALAQQMAQRNGNAASLRIVGVDGSAGMLRVARSRDAGVEWVFGDIRSPPVQGSFDLAFCCYNTLQHLLDDEDLVQAFRSVRGLIQPDGVFAFDIYQPNVAYLSAPQTNRMARSIIDRTGRYLEIREDHVYDPDTQLATFCWRLVERDKPGEPPLARTRYRFRQYFPADLDRLLSSAGLFVHERYGDFDRSPFSKDSKKQILICGQS
jgi:SAM-dependent methyltransferase